MKWCALDFDTLEHLEFAEKLEKAGYKYLSQGSYRRTFINSKRTIVIKIPKNAAGTADNIREADAYKKSIKNPYPNGMMLAPCRLLSNDCLMMVVVDIAVEYETMPEWAKRIDSAQVGLYKNKLVAYDYALDVKEYEHQKKKVFW